MLQISNLPLFNQIVSESLAKVQNDSRWTNAINKAVANSQNDQANFMEFDGTQLIIWSQGSNKIYSSNGVCQCRAYEMGMGCWHRALARLMRLYAEAEVNYEAHRMELTDLNKEMDNALYYKPEVKSVKMGGFRI